MPRPEGLALALDYLLHDGEHQHLCPVCEQTWWHDASPDECVETWTWTCPIDTGLSKAAVT
jgi:hypothetical protein